MRTDSPRRQDKTIAKTNVRPKIGADISYSFAEFLPE